MKIECFLLCSALATFCGTGNFLAVARLIVPVVLMSVLSTLICVALAKYLGPRGIPYFTLPFNFAAFMFLSGVIFYLRFPNPFKSDPLPSRLDGYVHSFGKKTSNFRATDEQQTENPWKCGSSRVGFEGSTVLRKAVSIPFSNSAH